MVKIETYESVDCLRCRNSNDLVDFIQYWKNKIEAMECIIVDNDGNEEPVYNVFIMKVTDKDGNVGHQLKFLPK